MRKRQMASAEQSEIKWNARENKGKIHTCEVKMNVKCVEMMPR